MNLNDEYESKWTEAWENGGYAWFESWEYYLAWTEWCRERGWYLPLRRIK